MSPIKPEAIVYNDGICSIRKFKDLGFEITINDLKGSGFYVCRWRKRVSKDIKQFLVSFIKKEIERTENKISSLEDAYNIQMHCATSLNNLVEKIKSED